MYNIDSIVYAGAGVPSAVCAFACVFLEATLMRVIRSCTRPWSRNNIRTRRSFGGLRAQHVKTCPHRNNNIISSTGRVL